MTQEAMIARPTGAAASWLLFTVVALAPLPFGSNEPVPIAFWCIALGICLVAVPVSRYLRATATWPSQAAVPPEKASVTAGS